MNADERQNCLRRNDVERVDRQRGWKNPVLYADKISGARTSRPQLNRLLQDIPAGRVRRLGRSLTHLALILDEMRKSTG